MHYNEETPFCLISETTVFNLEAKDVIYVLENNELIRPLIT